MGFCIFSFLNNADTVALIEFGFNGVPRGWRIEKNPALTIPERRVAVIIPVSAIPPGYKWDELGDDLLAWLKANHGLAPKEGSANFRVPVGVKSRKGWFDLGITLHTIISRAFRAPA